MATPGEAGPGRAVDQRTRTDAERMRALAAELAMVVGEEGVVRWKRRPQAPQTLT